jgi:hypothetical protein
MLINMLLRPGMVQKCQVSGGSYVGLQLTSQGVGLGETSPACTKNMQDDQFSPHKVCHTNVLLHDMTRVQCAVWYLL